MYLVFFVSLMLSLIFFIPVVQQGVFLVVVVFSIVVFMSLYIGFVGFSWYGFSLFLIYVGGLFVMFGYVISMIPNFYFYKFSLLGVFFLSILVSYFVTLKFFFFDLVQDFGGFLYSADGCFVVIGLGIVLFLSLVCVVKICYFSKGSLRPFSV